ncbi:MAG: outer membrane beta-barrel protein [Bacteroidales bacterium]|nr:outer membrane beta-barrel protein [Bacteroidales bacterium]
MKRTIFITFFLLLMSFNAYCQEKQQEQVYALYGFVGDRLMHQALVGTKVVIMTADSVALDSMVTTEHNGIFDVKPAWWARIPKAGRYVLRFSKEGYETLYVPVNIKKLYKSERSIYHEPVYLNKKAKEQVLGEAVVKATKVKFYSKGDTLVFNADTFQLQEGSMLDELIRQLPGVELKDDGRILVNGKYVESLLLNGEDFFKKDRSVMLDNLPTYMVKTVQVYEKGGRMSDMMGQNVGDEALVMDVRLKKEYSIGWIGNVEAAGGTDERYLARLFALRFTNHSRISVYGGVNNVNDYTKPGVGSEWIPDAGSGLTTSRSAGLDYLVNDRRKRFKLEGNAEVRHNDDFAAQHGTQVNFLEGGDTYRRSRYSSRSHSVSASSSHTLNFDWNKVKLNVQPSFSYQKNRRNSAGSDGTFSAEHQDYATAALLDSLFLPELSQAVQATILNRNRTTQKSDGHSLTGAISAMAVVKLPHTNNRLMVEGNGNYADSKSRTYAHKLYDYPNATDAEADFRNEFTDAPSRSYAVSGKVAYWIMKGKNWQIQPYYQYGYNYNRRDKSLMRLDAMQDGEWGEGTAHALGSLPSVYGWEAQTLDGNNSLYLTARNDSHTAGLYIHKETMGWNFWRWTFSLPLSFDRHRLDYLRPSQADTAMTRHVVFFRPSLQGSNTWYIKNAEGRIVGSHELGFGYSLNNYAQPLSASVDVRDDSNPLSVTLGNPNLKNTWQHSANVSYKWSNSDTQRMVSANANYTETQNALVMGYVYDKSTGVYTYRPDNVNGNRTLTGALSFSTPLDRAKRFTLQTNTSSTYYRNVDLIGVGDATEAVRSVVNNVYLSQGLRVDYSPSTKYKFGLKGNGTWTHATSRREDFSTVNAADYSYGVTAQVELPAGFQLSTDFTVYSRRGYEDAQMNTDDVVWNMRLAKRVLSNRISIMLDGFDLLGQLSNVRRNLNGQGRTETWYNTISRYAMLHVIYRLNVKPKK